MKLQKRKDHLKKKVLRSTLHKATERKVREREREIRTARKEKRTPPMPLTYAEAQRLVLLEMNPPAAPGSVVEVAGTRYVVQIDGSYRRAL